MERAELRDRIGTIGRLLSAEWSHHVMIDPITAREWGGLLKEAAEQLHHLAEWATDVEQDNGQLRRDIDRLRLSAKSLELQLVERRPAPQGVNNGA